MYSLLFTVLLRQRMLKDSIVEVPLRLPVTPMKAEAGTTKEAAGVDSSPWLDSLPIYQSPAVSAALAPVLEGEKSPDLAYALPLTTGASMHSRTHAA